MILENPSHSHKFLGKTEKYFKQYMHLVDNLQTCKPNHKYPKKKEHSNLIIMLFIVSINSGCAIYGVSIHHTWHTIGQTQRFCLTHPCKIFKALLEIKEHKCSFWRKVFVHTCTSFVLFKVSSKNYKHVEYFFFSFNIYIHQFNLI